MATDTNQIFLSPGGASFFYANILGNTTILADADGEMLAIKYVPQSTSPIASVDLLIEVTGDTSGINFRIRIESDNGDAPSGTVLGATNNAISASFTHTVDGFTGLKALSENTGNLTVNVPVWIVLYRQDGNSLSGSNYIALRGAAAVVPFGNQMRARHYNGSNWTTTAVSITRLGYVVQLADSSYSGLPYTAIIATPTSATDIYDSYRHGIRFKVGSQIKVTGLAVYLVKTGTPNNLIVGVFEGATLKYSQEIPSASIVTATWTTIWFSSPVLLAADTNLYIVLGQEDDANDGTLGDDGGNDSNDYDSRVATFSSTYKNCSAPPDFAFVYGNGNDPTALTVSDTDMVMILPVISDPATQLDQAAAGGGPLVGSSALISA